MGSFLAWDQASNFLFFDVVFSETHNASSTVTEHPVEMGADVTDHVRPNVDRVMIEGFISNAPIYSDRGQRFQVPLDIATYTPPISLNPVAALTNAVGGAIQNLLSPAKPAVADIMGIPNAADFVNETYAVLDDLRKTATLVDVYSPNWTHLGMIIEEFEMTKDQNDGTGATFKISLRQIITVQTTLTDVPVPAVARAAEQKAKGNQAPQAPDAAKSSAALGLLGGSVY